jgi:hypothetical protein
MQYFGKYESGFSREFLSKGYFYIPVEDEQLSVKEFEALIKTNKLVKKNTVGTVFLYSPYYHPIGLDTSKYLDVQNFDRFGEFVEIQVQKELTLFRKYLKEYKGKLIEVKYLFNLNSHNIDSAENLMALNQDCELLNSGQLTIFDKSMNYHDEYTMQIQGKFIFFAWGVKINFKEFCHISNYAKALYDKCIQSQKSVSFVYKKSVGEEDARQYMKFVHVLPTKRLKSETSDAFFEAFKTTPPSIICLDDVNI